MSEQIKACDHNFVYLRQYTWHNFVVYDIFFCSKCLEQRSVEALQPAKRNY